MKNPVTILLMAVYLFAYTDIVQVFKFPTLIKHYKEHHSKDKSVGFIDFLMMHYVNCDDGDSRDDREDMQLPFKIMDLHFVGNAIVVPYQSIIPSVPEEIYNNYSDSYFTQIIPSAIGSSLLRPPISLA